MDEMCCSDMIRKYVIMKYRWRFDSFLVNKNSQVAQWLRAGGAGNVLIPNLSDTTNTSKV